MPIAYSILPCAPIRVCTCRLCMTMSCCSRGMHAHSTPQTQGFLMSSKSAPAQHFISSLIFHSGRTAPSGWPLISNKYFELSSAAFPLNATCYCLSHCYSQDEWMLSHVAFACRRLGGWWAALAMQDVQGYREHVALVWELSALAVAAALYMASVAAVLIVMARHGRYSHTA